MSRTKSNTIESMGIEAFLNEYHKPHGYNLFKEMLRAGKPDSEIAKAFSSEHRKLNYQTVANWRRAYITEGK